MNELETNPYLTLLKQTYKKKFGDKVSLTERAEYIRTHEGGSFEQAMAYVVAVEQTELYPDFFLAALGDALSKDFGWAVRRADAIVFALTEHYGWTPESIRKMAPRDQWLALPDAQKRVALDPLAMQAWETHQKSPLTAPEAAYWNLRDAKSILS